MHLTVSRNRFCRTLWCYCVIGSIRSKFVSFFSRSFFNHFYGYILFISLIYWARNVLGCRVSWRVFLCSITFSTIHFRTMLFWASFLIAVIRTSAMKKHCLMYIVATYSIIAFVIMRDQFFFQVAFKLFLRRWLGLLGFYEANLCNYFLSSGVRSLANGDSWIDGSAIDVNQSRRSSTSSLSCSY